MNNPMIPSYREEIEKEFERLLRAYRLRIEQQRTPKEDGAESATIKVVQAFSSTLESVESRLREEWVGEIEKLERVTTVDKPTYDPLRPQRNGAYNEALKDILALLQPQETKGPDASETSN